MSYTCKTCGKSHDDLPDLGCDKPDPYFGIPDVALASRVSLTPDTCVIDNDYFIRGVIEVPLLDYDRPFGIGAWISLKHENFKTYIENPYSDQIGPFFGWLCTRIAYFEDSTMLLKTLAYFRSGNMRPLIELEPTDHPLAVAQREGITLHQASEIVEFYSSNLGDRS